MKWEKLNEVICDREFALNLKMRAYQTIVKAVIIYVFANIEQLGIRKKIVCKEWNNEY